MILSLIKLGVLIALLLYASIKDIRSREVPDSVSGMTLILGLVGITAGDLPSMLLGMALVFLPQYLAAIINPAKALGGADIKLSSAAAFLLGAPRGLFALIVGLTLSVITVPIVRKVKKLPKNQPFPLVPFLAVGIIAAYLRHYRTVLMVRLRRQISRQTKQTPEGIVPPMPTKFVQYDGKDARKRAIKAKAVNCAVLP